MSKFVIRTSKYRHVFGTARKKDACYDGIKLTRSAWDSNYIKASNNYLGVCWDAGGGGAFAVINQSDAPGRLGSNVPLFNGHTGHVLDIDFHPFNEQLVASCSEDCTIKLWGIPEGGLTESTDECLQELTGHQRKVGELHFNPVAENILLSTSTDHTAKIWDIESGEEKCNIEGHGDIIQSCSWNWNGSQILTSCRDKKVRILDPRQNAIAQETDGHAGIKGSRCVWMGKKDKLFVSGFSRSSDRIFGIWDPRAMEKPIAVCEIDTASGIIMPFYDEDTGVMFLAGKGDGNIRYYEFEDEKPYYFYLNEYKSNVSARGMAMLPKRSCNVYGCEIARLFKLTANTIEPIDMVVPRKSDMFQDDIFPEMFAHEAALTADQWMAGEDAEPKLMDAKIVYEETKPGTGGSSSSTTNKPKKMKSFGGSNSAKVAELEAKVAELEAKVAELTKENEELKSA